MARRNSNSVVLSDGDWATLWQCGCGYANTGREHCLICGTKAPSEVQHSAGLHVEQELIPHQRREEDPHAGRRATRTVVATVGVNLALQVLEAAGFAVAGTSQASAIRISLFTGLAYYGLVGVWVLARESWPATPCSTRRRRCWPVRVQSLRSSSGSSPSWWPRP